MSQMMKCVVKERPEVGALALTERPIPTYGANDILVKVKAAAVCGTDVHIMEWNEWSQKRINPPTIIGHEFAGEVIAVGDHVTTIKIGDLVSAETHIVCNSCSLCHNGNEHVCPNTKTIGVARDGCFAEYISIPAENAIVYDPSTPVEIVSIMEPFGVAVHAAMEFPVAGKTVLVNGCGPIGVMAIAVAKKCGAAKVFAVEINKQRGELALKMGADEVLNPMEVDVVKEIKAKTAYGAEVVIEFTGNIRAIKTAIECMAPEGKMAAAGLPDGSVDFNFSEFVYSGKVIKGIAGRLMYKTWEDAKGLIAGGLDLSPIITHTLPLEEFQEGLHLMKSGECCKAILIP